MSFVSLAFTTIVELELSTGARYAIIFVCVAVVTGFYYCDSRRLVKDRGQQKHQHQQRQQQQQHKQLSNKKPKLKRAKCQQGLRKEQKKRADQGDILSKPQVECARQEAAESEQSPTDDQTVAPSKTQARRERRKAAKAKQQESLNDSTAATKRTAEEAVETEQQETQEEQDLVPKRVCEAGHRADENERTRCSPSTGSLSCLNAPPLPSQSSDMANTKSWTLVPKTSKNRRSSTVSIQEQSSKSSNSRVSSSPVESKIVGKKIVPRVTVSATLPQSAARAAEAAKAACRENKNSVPMALAAGKVEMTLDDWPALSNSKSVAAARTFPRTASERSELQQPQPQPPPPSVEPAPSPISWSDDAIEENNTKATKTPTSTSPPPNKTTEATAMNPARKYLRRRHRSSPNIAKTRNSSNKRLVYFARSDSPPLPQFTDTEETLRYYQSHVQIAVRGCRSASFSNVL